MTINQTVAGSIFGSALGLFFSGELSYGDYGLDNNADDSLNDNYEGEDLDRMCIERECIKRTCNEEN